MSDLSGFNVPWKNESDTSLLDIGYYWHSAQKLVSPFVVDMLGTSNALSTEQRTLIAGTIFKLYGRKWNRQHAAIETQYDPIDNYRMSESETVARDVTRSDSDTGTLNTSNTGTITDSGSSGGTVATVTDGETTNTGTSNHSISDGGTVTTVTDGETTNTGTSNHSIADGGTVTTVTDGETTNTGTQSNVGSSNTQDGIFGFNSSVSVGSDTSDNQNTNTRTDNLASTEDETVTETRATTRTDNRTDNLASTEDETVTETRATTRTDNRTDNLASTEDVSVTETRNLSDSNTRTLNTIDLVTRNLSHSGREDEDTSRSMERSGTTGIYSPQQLIEQEIELLQWTFYQQVFADIDSVLCLSVY